MATVRMTFSRARSSSVLLTILLVACGNDSSLRDAGQSVQQLPNELFATEATAEPALPSAALAMDIVYTTYLDAGDGFHICTAKLGAPVESGSGPYPAPAMP